MNRKSILTLALSILFIFPLLVWGQNEENLESVKPELKISEINFEELTNSVENINQAAEDLKNKVRLEINSSINQAIQQIRSEKDIEAYILQRSVDTSRTEAFDSLDIYLEDMIILDLEIVGNLEFIIKSSLENIEQGLVDASYMNVSLDSAKNMIDSYLNEFKQIIEENSLVVIQNNGDLMFKDSDDDGLSDFDEIYIYNTDPLNPGTAGSSLNDGENVSLGLNPLSETGESKNYEDPRVAVDAYISKAHKIESIEVREDGFIEISGTAVPNSYVTVYIFSTPIIVTVKTDNRGRWAYTLDKALEDGNHEIYVATVDNSGKILARNEGNMFAKSAGAITMSSMSGTDSLGNKGAGNYLQDNYILIISVILLIGFIITISLFGKKPEETKIIDGSSDDDEKNTSL
jgi:hypothetical protein